MLRFVASAVMVAVLLTGCSHRQSIDPEELNSDAAELTSIAAEAELFTAFIANGHATDAYAKGHREYLREQLKDLRKDLGKQTTDPRLQNELETLQKRSHELDETLTAVPATAHDPRWPKLAADFARIARSIQHARQSR